METVVEFKDGVCSLSLTPSDDWERVLLGAIAKGGLKLDAQVIYKPQGHPTYGKAEVVKIRLTATQEQTGLGEWPMPYVGPKE